MPGKMLLAAEAHAAIDEDPLPVVLRTETVERGIHADFAETAERDENEFVVGGIH